MKTNEEIIADYYALIKNGLNQEFALRRVIKEAQEVAVAVYKHNRRPHIYAVVPKSESCYYCYAKPAQRCECGNYFCIEHIDIKNHIETHRQSMKFIKKIIDEMVV